jgi:hypothetical protein
MAAIMLLLRAPRLVRRPPAVRVSDDGAAQAVEAGKDRTPASESLRRTNPRDSGEELVVYGELVSQGRWLGMVLRGLVRAASG